MIFTGLKMGARATSCVPEFVADSSYRLSVCSIPKIRRVPDISGAVWAFARAE